MAPRQHFEEENQNSVDVPIDQSHILRCFYDLIPLFQQTYTILTTPTHTSLALLSYLQAQNALENSSVQEYHICTVSRKQNLSDIWKKMTLDLSVVNIARTTNTAIESPKVFVENIEAAKIVKTYLYSQENKVVLFIELDDQYTRFESLRVFNNTFSTKITSCHIYLDDNIMLSQSYESLAHSILDKPLEHKPYYAFHHNLFCEGVSSGTDSYNQSYSFKIEEMDLSKDALPYDFHLIDNHVEKNHEKQEKCLDEYEAQFESPKKESLGSELTRRLYCKKCNSELPETRDSSLHETPLSSPSGRDTDKGQEQLNQIVADFEKKKEEENCSEGPICSIEESERNVKEPIEEKILPEEQNKTKINQESTTDDIVKKAKDIKPTKNFENVLPKSEELKDDQFNKKVYEKTQIKEVTLVENKALPDGCSDKKIVTFKLKEDSNLNSNSQTEPKTKGLPRVKSPPLDTIDTDDTKIHGEKQKLRDFESRGGAYKKNSERQAKIDSFKRNKQQRDLQTYTNCKEETIAGLVVGRKKFLAECKTKSKRLVGLKNHKNTCYMNAILQSLSNTPLFVDYFLQRLHKDQKGPKDLSRALAKFFNRMKFPDVNNSFEKKLSNQTFKIKSLIAERNVTFDDDKQHDVLEFLKTLLEGINRELNRIKDSEKAPYTSLSTDCQKKSLQALSDEWFEYGLSRENSIVTDLFCGQILNEMICGNCQEKTISFDNCWDLALGFPNEGNDTYLLNKLIKYFLREELIAGYGCKKCGQTNNNAVLRHHIWRLPEILIINLKRFRKLHHKLEKVQEEILFPVIDLDMKPFVEGSEDKSCNDTKYRLFALVDHYGTLEAGHYTADCLNSDDMRWYHFNDCHAEDSKLQGSEWHSSAPSLLFYIKSSYLKN